MPAFVQEKDAKFDTVGTPTPSSTIAYTTNNVQGNCLIAFAAWFNSVTLTVTDSQGNLWQSLPVRIMAGSPPWMQLWYAFNCKGGANTVTFSFSGAGATFDSGAILEYSGVNALDNYDIQANASSAYNGNSANYGSTFSFAAATHDSSELVIGYASTTVFVNWTAGGSFTLRTTAASQQFALSDVVPASNGSFAISGTMSVSGNWAVGTATFYQRDTTNTFVQEVDHDDGQAAGAVTDSMTFYNNNTGGNLLFAFSVWVSSVDLTSVTDSLGNTWLPLCARQTVTGAFGRPYYAVNCRQGPNTVSFNYSGAGATFIGASISEWRAGALDQANQAGQAASTTPTSPSITTTAANELLLGWGVVPVVSPWTSGTGWASRTANNRSIWLGSKFNQAINTYTSTITVPSETWVMGIASFSGTPAGGGSGAGLVSHQQLVMNKRREM